MIELPKEAQEAAARIMAARQGQLDWMRQPGAGPVGHSLGMRDDQIQTSRNFAVLIEQNPQMWQAVEVAA